MINDKRQVQRRPLRHNAWILAGPEKSFACTLSDVSNSGARLNLEDSSEVPDRFYLLLSERGTVRRTCHVVWRKPNQLGVRFEHGLAAAKKELAAPTLQPEAGAVAETVTEPAPAAQPSSDFVELD